MGPGWKRHANCNRHTQGRVYFHVPRPHFDPGAFLSGTWNYPIEYGITIRGIDHAGVLANHFEAMVSKGSFDATANGTPSFNVRCFAASMRGKFRFPSPGLGANAGWKFINCVPTSGTNPHSFLHYDALAGVNNGPLEGMELSIVDAQSAAFGGVLSGGGSNHYKGRYNGTNWIELASSFGGHPSR
jgi:hypothetical protein